MLQNPSYRIALTYSKRSLGSQIRCPPIIFDQSSTLVHHCSIVFNSFYYCHCFKVIRTAITTNCYTGEETIEKASYFIIRGNYKGIAKQHCFVLSIRQRYYSQLTIKYLDFETTITSSPSFNLFAS